MELDPDRLARELLIALRGRRSQLQWSRRLGYRSNVAYTWESGRRAPTAAETFRAARRTGVDLDQALTTFFGSPPAWLDELDPATPEGVAQLLEELRGTVSITELAERSGLSRYSISRWLSGHTQPKLGAFLQLVEASSLRMVDLLACLVSPDSMPSLQPHWERLEARRRGAMEHPWTQAVLRALELEDYLALPQHEEGWIARRLGISLDEELRCLDFLQMTHMIEPVDGRLISRTVAVDTRRHPDASRRLKAHWSLVATERIRKGAAGQFSYNVFTVSRRDFERIRQLHLEYYTALRGLVAESESGECVAVANVQLFALDA